jgi:hypothetical protein
MSPTWLCLVVSAWLALVGVATADVIPITGNSGASTEMLGAYTGSLNYSASDHSHAQLIVQLTNTSPVANGGFLTAFALNNPGGITGIGFSSSQGNFGPLGGPGNNGIAAPPFGDFDFGASITDSFLGGGAPQPGLGVGESATFTFDLTGTDLDTLTLNDFLTTFGDDASPDHDDEFFVARFRGFNNGGSDKVPASGGGGGNGDPAPEVPEPATLLLWGILGAGIVVAYRLRAA